MFSAVPFNKSPACVLYLCSDVSDDVVLHFVELMLQLSTFSSDIKNTNELLLVGARVCCLIPLVASLWLSDLSPSVFTI